MYIVCFRLEQIGVACERARLPSLREEPLALTDAAGTVLVASDEAARFGVSGGQTIIGARSLCPHLVALPYDCASYECAARPVWDALATLSNVVEPESPEVCFALMRGSDAPERVRRLTEEIARRIHIPVRVGIARTKFVARRAAHQDAEHKTVVVPFGGEALFLADLPLAGISRLDHKARQQMERLGVRTLGDILALPPNRLPRSLRWIGNQLLQWAQGHDSDPVRPLWPPRTLSERLDFEEETCDRFLVENALLRLSERIAPTLAREHEFGREVSLRVGLGDGTWREEAERLALPLSLAPPLFRAAVRLLQRLGIDQPITSLELVVGDLGSGSGTQLALLDDGGELPHERQRRLEAALAFLRKRYGVRIVVTGALLAKARRIGLWTFPLGHLLDAPVQVATDHRGDPVRYWRTGQRGRERRRYDVLRIQNRWRETHWRGSLLADEDVWRVETDPWGLSELHRLDAEWRLGGVMD